MGQNLLDELLLLCRAAAEAGEDWRSHLRQKWLPQLLAKDWEGLRQALSAWQGAPVEESSLEAACCAALEEAMAEAGYQ